MLFLSSPGGVGIAPTIELSSCHRDDIRPVAVLPPFSRFRTNESHVQDCFWSWDALQVLWRLQTDLQNTLHDDWLGGDGSRWRVACPGTGVQRHDISGIGLVQSLEPFAHPGTGHSERIGQVLLGPLWVLLSQPT